MTSNLNWIAATDAQIAAALNEDLETACAPLVIRLIHSPTSQAHNPENKAFTLAIFEANPDGIPIRRYGQRDPTLPGHNYIATEWGGHMIGKVTHAAEYTSLAVSRDHGSLLYQSGTFFLMDNGSSGGTYYAMSEDDADAGNIMRVDGSVELEDGMVLYLGNPSPQQESQTCRILVCLQ